MMKRLLGTLLIAVMIFISAQGLAAPGKTWTKNTRAGKMTFTEIDGAGRIRMFLGFYDGVAGYQSADTHLWGAVDTAGNIVFEPYWEEMTIYSHGLAGVKKDGLWGCIDTAGQVVIQPYWEIMETTFSEGLRAVCKDKLWGYIDMEGNVVIEPQYTAASNFSEGLAAVKKDGLWGYIDAQNNYIIAPSWEGGLSANSSQSYSKSESYEGSVLIGSYKDAGSFCSGVAVLTERTGRYSLIDREGNYILQSVDLEMYGCDPQSGGTMLISNDNGVGFMNTTGEIFIKQNPEWYSAYGFCDGYAMVMEVSGSAKRGYQYDWYYIDMEGNRIGNRTWDEAYSFLEGKALVQDGRKLGFIDETGELLFPMEQWGFASDFVGGYAMVLRNGKMTIIHCEEIDLSNLNIIGQVTIGGNGTVNVRADSNSDSDRVGRVQTGETYPCVGVAENGWNQIVLTDGTIGYVSGNMSTLL